MSLSGEPDRPGGGGADIEYPPDVVVRGPVEGWQFSAGFQRAGDPCART